MPDSPYDMCGQAPCRIGGEYRISPPHRLPPDYDALLTKFYGLCSMRTFAFAYFLPSTVALLALAVLDRVRGEGRLWRAVVVGGVAGVIAACAYDVFRLPVVFAREWCIDAVVPPLMLFGVFPRFGAMILGEPVEQGGIATINTDTHNGQTKP